MGQSELEKFDGVSTGKYTIGLGQTKMAFCDDREGKALLVRSAPSRLTVLIFIDIYSMALTTVSSLLRKYSIDTTSIGRIEVGTETILDKSKSVKSVLMQLFAPSGNTNVEGVDTLNACYGGTNALFNTLNWVESSAWDGRDAIVVVGDIALYKKGNARPTGGAGCVAMLIGPNAPLVFEPGMRSTYMRHVYDFYKADLTSEYPLVDGHYSVRCYTESVDACYKGYFAKKVALEKNAGLANGFAHGHALEDRKTVPLDHFDYNVFHVPTCKTVAKSYGRMLYNDYLADPTNEAFSTIPPELKDVPYDESLVDRNVEKAFTTLSKKRFAERVQPGTFLPTMCGNMYCASLYGALVSLISMVPQDKLLGKRVGLFSYGSGLASSLFSLKVKGDVSAIVEKVDMQTRLEARNMVEPMVYVDVGFRLFTLREVIHRPCRRVH